MTSPLVFVPRADECRGMTPAAARCWLGGHRARPALAPKAPARQVVDVSPRKNDRSTRIHRHRSHIEVRVRDNGTGIPVDIRDKLFQPFFTTKPTGEGTGLGLSISYDIITQQHGGSIDVASEQGAYTEFTIRLPRPLPNYFTV